MPAKNQTEHAQSFPTESPCVKRILIGGDPFVGGAQADAWGAAVWPGSWVWLDGEDVQTPIVTVFRCRFTTVENDGPIRLHLTADERYELYLDGKFVGRGPERGDGARWYYDTLELNLSAGEHVLVARVWALGETDYLSPAAQMSIRPGFLVAAQGAWSQRISTGLGTWQAKRFQGYRHLPPPMTEAGQFAGGFECVDGRQFDWGFERGEGGRWDDVVVIEAGQSQRFGYGEHHQRHRLTPAQLPPRLQKAEPFSKVRFVSSLTYPQGVDPVAIPVSLDKHDPEAAARWSAMMTGDGTGEPVVVPANTRLRVVIDAEDYLTGFPELTVSGGADAVIRMHWAEALFESPKPATSGDAGQAVGKGNRNEINGKYFRGKGDTFITDGGDRRFFTSLWWRAGRYVQLIIETGPEALRIDGLMVRQSYYPLADHWDWNSDEPRLDAAIPLMRLGLRACMHEQFTDCPYYEQLMYTGDTRLEALTCYLLSRDDRLTRKAIGLQEASRLPNGLTQARFPCCHSQVIPGFSLWWVGMVHDQAKWRGDKAFVREMMPGVRSVAEAGRGFVNQDGLVEAPDGWNFVDWVHGWEHGCPPGATAGVNTTMNWQFAWTLMLKARLEEWVGEKELADRDRRDACALSQTITGVCWDASRGLFAETPGGEAFSEHTQCMALLSGLLDSESQQRTITSLVDDSGLDRCTIYFSFYLMEVLGQAGSSDAFFDNLARWYGLKDLGLICTPESPEPTRSDCHAWGAHPMYHLYATILGMRPAGYGMDRLTIRPMLGPLQHIAGRCAHPRGEVVFEINQHDGVITGHIGLPSDVNATLDIAGKSQAFTGRIDF